MSTMTIHPTFDPTTNTWFCADRNYSANRRHREAKTIRELLALFPPGTQVKDYYPNGTPRDLLPKGLIGVEPNTRKTQQKSQEKRQRGNPDWKKGMKAPRNQRGLKPNEEAIYEEPYRAPMIQHPLYPPGKERDDAVVTLWATNSGIKIAKQLRISVGSVASIIYRLRLNGDPRLSAAGAVGSGIKKGPGAPLEPSTRSGSPP